MDLVRRVGIPNDELSILRGGDKMSSIGRPMHGVNLGQMTLERALSLHQLVLWDRLVGLLGDGADC